MPNQSGTHKYMHFTVTIANDGAISVRSGDTISGYCAAIYQVEVTKTRKYWGEFGRILGNNSVPTPLADPHSINTGEVLYHIPTFKAAQIPPLPKRLRNVLNHINDKEARCLVRKSIKLLETNAPNALEDAWLGFTQAKKAARYGKRPSGFDYEFARTALDKSANHVLRFLHNAADESEKDVDLAKAIEAQSKRIAKNVSDIRAQTRGAGQANKPALSTIDEWMNKRVSDKSSILHCYRGAYGVKR